MLCDERVAVRKQEGRFWVYGTPWHRKGRPSTPGPAALERLFIIEHGNENRARQIQPAEAVALLLARAYLPLWDPAGMAFSLEFLEDLCGAIPCYRLGFTPDRRAVEYVECLSSS